MTDAARQFDRTAPGYLCSASHAGGRTLARLLTLCPAPAGARVLDVATGAGHVALAYAEAGAQAIALDPAAGMLTTTREHAARRGLAVDLVGALAEALPLADASCEVVVCRTAAHHFVTLARALAEMARVVRPGGRVGISDLQGHEDAETDALVHTVERLHDPTHVRSLTRPAWRAALTGAGLDVIAEEGDYGELDEGHSLVQWCERSKTPPADVERIRALLSGAPPHVRETLHVRADGDDVRFWIHKCVLVARRPD